MNDLQKHFVSVIVPVKDMAETLQACIQALRDQRGVSYGEDYEVIVVDDGSTDRSAEVARSAGVRVYSQKQAGAAAARNMGAKLAQGDLLAFTDADCVPNPNWIARIGQAFENPEVVGVRGIYTSSQKEVMARFVQQEYTHKYARMGHFEKIDFIDTYSAAYRKDIFLENGGFDERFPRSSVEDQEFSFRLATKGYRLEFHPELVVSHTHDRTLPDYVRRKFWIGYWKAELLRWLPEKTFSDSHTPPSQRVQILTLGLGLLSLLVGIFWPVALWLALVPLILFLLSSVPFLRWVAQKDRGVSWAVPGLLVLRAAALGTGLAVGILSPKRTDQPLNGRMGLINRLLKRGLDLAGSVAGLILSAPVIIISAIAIKLDDGGPVFFYQQRAGEGGHPFRLVKLRTMAPGSEEKVDQVLTGNDLQGPVFKIPNDPRVTRAGRFLRRWSLDESPQFWNVLIGDMSLVGPRPEETRIVEQYSDHQRMRLVVKPGLTGPMQINGRGKLHFNERLELELEYISHYSIWLDLSILAKTIPVVIKGDGAF